MQEESRGGAGRSLAEDALSAFLHAPIAVAVCEPDGVVTRVNKGVVQLLGYPAAELLGRDLFRLVDEALVGEAIAACASLLDRSVDTTVLDTRFHTKDANLLDVRVTTSAVRAPTTPHPHIIMHLENITDREDLRRRLQHEASHDPLTGLCNRVRFLGQLRRALPRGVRHEQPVTVLYLDLDSFKAVNDTYGHAAGDRLLIAFAEHVRASVRPEDTAARLGGDEFAVLCENTTAAQAAEIVERLATGSWGSRSWSSGSWSSGSWSSEPPHTSRDVTVTVGTATSPGSDGRTLDAEQLLHEADAAMYAAKSRQKR